MVGVRYTHIIIAGAVDGTKVARSVKACANFPVAGDDPVTRSVQAANPDVILMNIPVDNSQFAVRAIELLHQEVPESEIFTIGLSQPQVIVDAMCAGAARIHRTTHDHRGPARSFGRLPTQRRMPNLKAYLCDCESLPELFTCDHRDCEC